MRKHDQKISAVAGVYALTYSLILFTLFSACSSETEKDGGKLKIVTTTGMIEDAVRNIVKDSADVEALMGPGVDPHLYKATQGDLRKLTESDIVLYNGLLLEGKMGEVLEKLSRIKPVFAVAEKIDKEKLISGEKHQTAYDPHIWFDVSLWKEAVGHISTLLQEQNPEDAAYYKKNTVTYQAKLDSLHQAVIQEVRKIPEEKRVLITAHDAFGYFGKAYDIEVIGLQGISTLTDFGLKDISDLVNLIGDRKIKAVFIETSVSEKAIRAVIDGVRQRGHEIKMGGSLYSDAMGSKGSKEGTYIGMVDANVSTIVNALSGDEEAKQ